MDYNPTITIRFIKKCKITLHDFNYDRYEIDIEKKVILEEGEEIEDIKSITVDPNDSKKSIIDIKPFKIDSEIAFETYSDVPKDSYIIVT